MGSKRDTYKYQFKVGNKVVHEGITNDLDKERGNLFRERIKSIY